MAKPLTRGEKAAATRQKNRTIRLTNANKLVAEPAASTDKFTAALLTVGAALMRIEKHLPERDEQSAYEPDGAAFPGNRIREVPPTKSASANSTPVSVLIDDVHSRTSGLRGRLESMRDALMHGISPEAPRLGGAPMEASTPSQGPAKDALNWSFSNLAASEALVEEIERYLLNR